MNRAERSPAADDQARQAAFNLAFDQTCSSPVYTQYGDEELLPRVQSQAPQASTQQCQEALSLVRRLCDRTFAIVDAYRDGNYGWGPAANRAAMAALANQCPGFSPEEYHTAFTAGLFWTAR